MKFLYFPWWPLPDESETSLRVHLFAPPNLDFVCNSIKVHYHSGLDWLIYLFTSIWWTNFILSRKCKYRVKPTRLVKGYLDKDTNALVCISQLFYPSLYKISGWFGFSWLISSLAEKIRWFSESGSAFPYRHSIWSILYSGRFRRKFFSIMTFGHIVALLWEFLQHSRKFSLPFSFIRRHASGISGPWAPILWSSAVDESTRWNEPLF